MMAVQRLNYGTCWISTHRPVTWTGHELCMGWQSQLGHHSMSGYRLSRYPTQANRACSSHYNLSPGSSYSQQWSKQQCCRCAKQSSASHFTVPWMCPACGCVQRASDTSFLWHLGQHHHKKQPTLLFIEHPTQSVCVYRGSTPSAHPFMHAVLATHDAPGLWLARPTGPGDAARLMLCSHGCSRKPAARPYMQALCRQAACCLPARAAASTAMHHPMLAS